MNIESLIYRIYFGNLEEANLQARELITDFYRTGDAFYAQKLREGIIENIEGNLAKRTDRTTNVLRKTAICMVSGFSAGITYNHPIVSAAFTIAALTSFLMIMRDVRNVNTTREMRQMKSKLIWDGSAVINVLEHYRREIEPQLNDLEMKADS